MQFTLTAEQLVLLNSEVENARLQAMDEPSGVGIFEDPYFTKYGVIDAQIVDLSNDARSDENLGLVYMAKVSIKDEKLLVNNKWVNLTPGMSVTVEVKTGTRRIIEFFLSPLLRYRDESIRER